MAIKLTRLADRTQVKLSISIPPTLAADLERYAEAYAEEYGEAEPLAELVPAIIAAFLDGDRGFARMRKTGADRGRASGPPASGT